jgi:orotate phosphoribosyltransferase
MERKERSAEQLAAGAETARILLDIEAVNFRPAQPYMLTAGWASPVYIDCRKVISHLDERRRLIAMAGAAIERDIGLGDVTSLAGGETAGIPYAAWISDALSLPMLYVRKRPKGFGRNAQIEGDMAEGDRVVLIEDLATDGGSKITFIEAMRAAGALVSDVFVIFFYGAFPGAEENMAQAGANLHYLADWWDVLDKAEADGDFSADDIAGVKEFLANPIAWSAAHGGRKA